MTRKGSRSWTSLVLLGLLLASWALIPAVAAEGEEKKEEPKAAEKQEEPKPAEKVEEPKPAEKVEEPKKDQKSEPKEQAKDEKSQEQANPADAKSGKQLDDAIKEAADAQNYLQEPDEKVVSQEIKQAPAAELANADGDVATTGDCKSDMIDFCSDVHPGASKLADCLTAQVAEEEKEGYSGKKLSEKCRKELDEFKIDRAQNVNKNVPLSKACAADAEKLCKDVPKNEENGVLACLREHKKDVSDKCQKELLEEMVEGADDFRKDTQLFDACKDDAEVVCPGVEPKEGQIQDCLRKHRNQISWECQDELFRQDQENADDLRLSVRLFRKCFEDKKKFCAEVAPGNARAKECLEEHRNDDGFSEECKKEVDKMIEQRVGDFRLDPVMREYCADDVEFLCAFQKESLEAGTELDARVVLCLQDYRDEINNPSCAARVHKYIELASQDIRFNVPLAEACYDDRITYCSQVPTGSARVIRCLQDKREKLSFDCKAALFDQEVLMSENIDFNYPMKVACTQEIEKFCKDVPHGHSRVIRCLSDNKDGDGFGNKCKEEVVKFEERAASDYRLNWQLEKSCEETVPQLCGDICEPMQVTPCGGKVLRCLVEKYENITNQDCRSEVFYFIKMEVKDFRNDIILAENCRPDVDKFCHNISPGEGRVHTCLQEHRDELTEPCRKEEIKLMVRQAANVEFTPSITKFCHEEMNVFCKSVRPGKSRMFHCLLVNAQQADFSNQCRQVLAKQVHKRTRDWRLDYGLFKNCGTDVPRLCSQEAKDADRGTGVVIRCLINKVNFTSDGCAKELSRVVSTALQFYQPNNPVTQVCDANVEELCIKDKDWTNIPVGNVRSCLTNNVFISGGGGGGGNITFDLDTSVKTSGAAETHEDTKPEEKKEEPKPNENKEEAKPEERKEEAKPEETKEEPKAEEKKDGTRKLVELVPVNGRHLLMGTNLAGEGEGNQLGNVHQIPRSQHLDNPCSNLILISIIGERAYGSFEAALSSSYLVFSFADVGKKADNGYFVAGSTSPPKPSGFVLTGWWALFGMFALAAILIAGGYYGYTRYYRGDKVQYTVIKNASV